jgi:hypothetical protein
MLATARGTVTDQQGAAVPQAVVTARETETNLKRSSTTQQDGQYLLSNLPAEQYEDTVASTDFRTATQPQLKLQVEQHLRLDFSLLLARTTESVVVNAQTDQLPTESVVGLKVGMRKIDALPTSERNFRDLAILSPGISSSGTSSMGSNASGRHQYQNNVFVDGAPNAMKFYGMQADVHRQDWIQEFKVMTNGFAPKFGNASGAFLSVIT